MTRHAAEPPRPLNEVAAPHWLVQLLRTGKKPISWGQVIRAMAALSAPVAVGMATGHLAVGVEAAMGSLCATFVARPGPYRYRMRRMGFASLTGAAGFLLGGLAGGQGWWTSGVMVMLAVVSAVVSSAGATASVAGLQLLVFGILGAGQPFTSGPYLSTVWFLAGAGWSLLLSVAAWPIRATAPERTAVAAVYERIAAMLRATGTRQANLARQRLTTALNEAYDALATARSRLEGRDAMYRSLFALLTAATPVAEAAVAAVKARRATPARDIQAVRAFADAVRTDRPLPPPDVTADSPLGRALLGVHDNVSYDTVNGTSRTPGSGVRARLTAWLGELTAGPAAWTHVARLALCVGLAEVVSRQLHLERSYWVALTVALVLKPDFGSVFARAVLRGGGTVLGVLLGAAVLAIGPRGWALVPFVAVFAAALPVAKERNYGLFSISVTPLVIVLLDLAQAGSLELVLARLIDTAVGCAIVLLFGYLLWPGSRRPRIGPQLADAADTLSRYTACALTPGTGDWSTLRRRTYRALSDLRVQAQRLISEPSPAGRQAAAWWPTIIGLERLTDAVTRVNVERTHGGAALADTDVQQVVAAITEVGGAIRMQREPRDQPLPATDQLATVAADITALYGALRGPAIRPGRRLRRRREAAR